MMYKTEIHLPVVATTEYFAIDFGDIHLVRFVGWCDDIEATSARRAVDQHMYGPTFGCW